MLRKTPPWKKPELAALPLRKESSSLQNGAQYKNRINCRGDDVISDDDSRLQAELQLNQKWWRSSPLGGIGLYSAKGWKFAERLVNDEKFEFWESYSFPYNIILLHWFIYLGILLRQHLFIHINYDFNGEVIGVSNFRLSGASRNVKVASVAEG